MSARRLDESGGPTNAEPEAEAARSAWAAGPDGGGGGDSGGGPRSGNDGDGAGPPERPGSFQRPDRSEWPERPVFDAPTTRPGARKRDLNLAQRYTRWAIWGCATLVFVGLLLGAGFLLVFLQRPGGARWLKSAERLAICQEHLQAVSGALERYNADNGHSPARLEDLYPTYLADRNDLYCPSDPAAPESVRRSRLRAPAAPANEAAGSAASKPADKGASGTSYVVSPSVRWGEGKAILVYCPHHPSPLTPIGVAKSDEPYSVPVIRQDGSVAVVTTTLEKLGGPGGAAPAPRPGAPPAPSASTEPDAPAASGSDASPATEPARPH